MAQLAIPIEVSLKNILVTTDFSEASLSALDCILPIAKVSNSVVHILHVIHPREIPIASPEAEADVSEQVQIDAQRRLASLENVVGTIPHRMWLREGEVWDALQDVIRSEHIDLVAVGASGKSDVKKFFVGSVAEEIVRKATCPVLTVGPHATSTRNGVSLAQLLYVTDFWEESNYGLEYAVRLAIQYKSRLMLLHVVEQKEPRQPDHEWLRSYRRILRNLLPVCAGDLPIEPVLRIEVSKHSSARILQVADEVKADVAIMDVRPEETWATHLPDKVYKIISWANCPVLTVRTKSEHDT